MERGFQEGDTVGGDNRPYVNSVDVLDIECVPPPIASKFTKAGTDTNRGQPIRLFTHASMHRTFGYTAIFF